MEPIKCTKNDEFQTAMCACEECRVLHEAAEAFAAEKPVIITDADMVEDRIRTWKGYVFKCPKCGQEAIMSPGKGCFNCLTPVVIRSALLTDHIKKLSVVPTL